MCPPATPLRRHRHLVAQEWPFLERCHLSRLAVQRLSSYTFEYLLDALRLLSGLSMSWEAFLHEPPAYPMHG
jgi:hypothetical protein